MVEGFLDSLSRRFGMIEVLIQTSKGPHSSGVVVNSVARF
jgi:hypothetical protein